MSTESSREMALGHLDQEFEIDRPDDINTVTVVFSDGEIQDFSLVVRAESADWVYAERCVDIDDEFTKEEIVSINSTEIRQIESDQVHLFSDGVMHFGECFLVEPQTILEDSWFEESDCTL